MVKVPWSDLDYGYEENWAVNEVLASNWPSRGKVTEEFEEQLSKYLGSNVVVVNNGASALMCALLANGVKAGDTVLVPDFTFIATASVPAIMGCKIVPVDANLETFNMEDVDYRDLSGKTLITTDIAGLPASFGKIGGIEDAAEALGSETHSHKTGAFEWLTIFSFQATKILSTIEGGAIASKDEELIAKCRKIANYGRTDQPYVHEVLGMNMRMTDVQAALGLVQLEKIEKNLRRRQKVADRYRKEIECVPQKIPSYVTRHSNWMFLASGLMDKERKLKEAGIEARRTFVPIHKQPCFPDLWDAKCPNATWIYNNVISLPIFNSITDDQVDYVIETCK